MGGHMLPGPERRRAARRSMRYMFAAIIAVPLVTFAVVWVLAGSAIVQYLTHGGQQSPQGTLLVRVTAAAGIGLIAILIATLLMAWYTRRVVRDVSSLGEAARLFADQQLPLLIERLRSGDELDLSRDLPAPPSSNITEIARVATVLAGVQRSTVAATASEIKVRSGISRVFVSLARRNQSLLQRQLRMIDQLERKAADPGTLADLFPLDHLTTRMRRHAEGLIILSGATPGRSWSNPVPVIDVVRGAIAEIEDYRRVRITSIAEGMMVGSAVADMIHLLAELVENATLFSPSGSQVDVRAERAGTGFAFEIEDRGLGIRPDDLDAINERLGSPTDFDLANADQLGLFVVGKLAARHGVRVFLRPSPHGGTTAIVVTPRGLVMHEAEMPAAPLPGPSAKAASHSEVPQLALTGRARRVRQAGPPWEQQAGPPWEQQTSPPLLTPGPSSRAAPPVSAGAPPVSPAPGPAPRTDTTGPMPSVPRRRASVPGRPDSVPMVDTHQGLPRRVRQASLSPHLRRGSQSPGDTAPAHDPEERSPEQARNLLASLQRGWERGRAAPAPLSGQGNGADISEHESPHQEG